MKRFLLGLVFLNSLVLSNLFADVGKNFEEAKSQMLQRVEGHLTHLMEHKNCIAAATKKEDLKACHEKMKAWREANQKEHHGKD